MRTFLISGQKPIKEEKLPRWIGGERVTREIYMDDGTWRREGDKCLPGPLKHGTVIDRVKNRSDAVLVRWDDGKEGIFLDHGINPE